MSTFVASGYDRISCPVEKGDQRKFSDCHVDHVAQSLSSVTPNRDSQVIDVETEHLIILSEFLIINIGLVDSDHHSS